MRRIFADTLYWVALLHRKDQWHQAALNASRALAGCDLVTTDEVLSEVLAAFCEAGAILCQRAAALVHRLPQRPPVTVHAQSRATFLTGLAFYEARPDKGCSLTDYVSIETMRQEGITEVLTHDDHSTQEGFTILL
jgi:predicted nucleic acid-binding protein